MSSKLFWYTPSPGLNQQGITTDSPTPTPLLRGDKLTDSQCSQLMALHELSDAGSSVPSLESAIFDLPADQVDAIFSGADPASFPTPPLGSLRGYQTIGVAFMLTSRQCVIADSVGLGKTAQVAGFINQLDPFSAVSPRPILVVTESNLVVQTAKELIRFTAQPVSIIPSQAKDIKGYLSAVDSQLGGSLPPVVVGSHSVMKSRVFQEWLLSKPHNPTQGIYSLFAVVVDESGVISSGSTEFFESATFFNSLTEFTVIMNATAFEGNLLRLYWQLKFVDESFLPGITQFRNEYEVKSFNPSLGYATFTGIYRRGEEFNSLIRLRYLKRTRQSMGARVSSCTSTLMVLDKSALQKTLYSKASRPQVVNDMPTMLLSSEEFSTVNTPKAGAVVDILTNPQASPPGSDWVSAPTVLVYCQFLEAQYNLARALQEQGISVGVLNGSTPSQVRYSTIQEFSEHKIRVLITNVMKGLNFPGTSHVIIYSLPGNTDSMVQFEGRVTRSFDVSDKHLIVLSMRGKELKRIRTVVSHKTASSVSFAGSDISLYQALMTSTPSDGVSLNYMLRKTPKLGISYEVFDKDDFDQVVK